MSTPTKSTTQPTSIGMIVRRSPRLNPLPRRSPRIEHMKARQDAIMSPRTREIAALLLSPQTTLIGGYQAPPSTSVMTTPKIVRRLVVENNGFKTQERRISTCEYVAIVGETMIVAIGAFMIVVAAVVIGAINGVWVRE